jgi:hypothetical protein
MKKLFWSLPFVIVGAIGAADSACTLTIDNGGPATDDSGTGPESTVVETGSDTSTTLDAAADMGSQQDSGAVADSEGGTCAATIDTGNATCDQCLDMACCAQLTACVGEPALDGSGTECLAIASCFNDCVSPPADSGVAPGTPAQCTIDCEGPDGGTYSAQGRTDFQNLTGCATGPACASSCPAQ